MRANAFQNKYNELLSGQIKVIVIKEVDLSFIETNKEKILAQLGLVKASGKLNCGLLLDIVVFFCSFSLS